MKTTDWTPVIDYYHQGTGHSAGDCVKAWKRSYNIGTAITYLARAGLKTEDPRTDYWKAIHHILMEMMSTAEAGDIMVAVQEAYLRSGGGEEWGV